MTAYDIVLHGATGFVGQLVADYIARHPEGRRFTWAIAGRNPDKLASALVEVRGAGDPGYLATSKMLTEVGLSLLLDEASPRAGVLTPATALGPVLRQRLAAAEEGRFMQFRELY